MLKFSLYKPHLRLSLVALLVFAVPCLANDLSYDWSASHGGASYNMTNDAKRVLCVYPLSGQYSLLNRLLYYALIIFAVVASSHPWLVTGPLAYVMTYSSTAAVHAVIMAVVSKDGLFDIDVLGTWAIISVGCLVILPIFTMSKTIQESQYSHIFGLWGTLVSIGAICSIVSIHREYPDEPECRSSATMQLLTSQVQLLDNTFNCSYTCFAKIQPLRGISEITAMPKSVAFGHFGIIEGAVGLTASLGILSGLFAFAPVHRKSTEAELRAQIHSNRARKGYDKYARTKASIRKRARKELETGQYTPSPFTICWVLLTCPSIVVVIVLNEVFILAYNGGFPSYEQPYTIGQWGPWVGVFLAVIAALMVKLHLPRWGARQKILAEENEALQKRKQKLENDKVGYIVDQNGSARPPPLSFVGELSKHTVDIEAGTRPIDHPVVAAADEGDTLAVQQHLSNPSQTPVVATLGAIALGKASANGNVEVVQQLLDSGVDVNEEDSFGLTALIRASWAGRTSVVKLLIKSGATVTDRQGAQAVARAATCNHFDVVELLRSYGAR